MAAQHQILNIKEISNDLSDSGNDKIKIKYTYQKNKLQKPRRNKSAFILFSNEARNQIKADEGNLNSNEMMVKLAARWKNLSKEESERYKLMAKNDKIRYQQELVNFAKLHPDETIHNKTKNNHVKKPCSAYGMFLREKKDLIKKQNPNLKMADILKLVSQDWKNLSEAQKKVYKDRAGVEKEEVRNKLCEAIIRDQTTKKTSTIPQSKGSKKVKKSPVAPALPDVPENLEATAVKTEDTMTLNHRNSSDLWPRFDETTLPLTLINEPSDIQIKTETLLEPEKKPSTIPLFSSTTSLDLMLNQSLFTKKQDSNINFNTAANNGADPGLLSLLSRQVQKPNELLADILNFDINFDNIKSVNLLETSLFKLKSESRNSISQFLNLSQARPAAPSRARILNETIMNVLDDQGSKDSFFEDPIAALEKKNLS